MKEPGGRGAHLEMPELPGTRAEEDTNLGNAIPDSAGIGCLAEIAVVFLPLALILLLAADIL